MTKQGSQITGPSDRWSYLWLAIGTLLSLFSSGKWTIPLTAWLGTVFMIRFMRTQKVFRGLILVWLATYVTGVITWLDIVGFGMPLPVALVTLAVNTLLIGGLPYLADRLLAPRLKGFAATLIFPLALTAMDFLSMTTSPLGSFGSQAYVYYGNLAFMQLLSVTGMWGLTFLASWFAPIVNWAWERSFSWPEIRRGLALYAGIMLAVMVFGGARLAFSHPQPGTVRVHSFTAVDFRAEQGELMQTRNTDWDAFRQMATDRYERYLEGTIREAQAGAQIVLWPEMAAMVAAEDEATLITRGQEVARQEGIYLAMSMGTVHQDEHPFENKLIVIDPAGDIVIEHYKYGGSSIEGSLPGDGILRTVETPFGTLSGVICWDTDFPITVSQAGRNGTDILLSASLDFRPVDPMHAQMAVFRAIENGVSVIRHADNGLSIVSDPYGRVLASMDHFTASEWVMVAQVPTRGVFTIYSIVGDLFGWLTIVGFVVVAAWAIVRGRKTARAISSPSEQGD
jgi:apolipoprotein N-acyltransferase